jgi:hypothetical protein
MRLSRAQFALAAALLLGSSVQAQPVMLAEDSKVNDCYRLALTMKLTGEMVVVQDGKPATLKLAASAEHRFDERVLTVDGSRDVATKVARYYADARAAVTVDGAMNPRTLRPERRLIVAQRPTDALLCYSPSGNLTREELEIVSEHFDTLALGGLLPKKSVAVGDSWKLGDAAVQALCLFDGLVSQDLAGKLVDIANGAAVFTVTGSAKGIELGAQVAVTISATGRFDLATKRIAALQWKQSDVRDQGPASPAVNAETIITIAREVSTEPKELSDIALVGVPRGFEAPDSLLRLTVRDVKGRLAVACSRDWQVTGQTESHTVLRLIERGEFVAQATITPWQKAEPGKHIDAKMFRDAMIASPGWSLEEVLQEGEMPGQPAGRWVYRLAARGQMESISVLQVFYLVAGPLGDQAVIAITFKPAQAAKLGARDVLLVDGLEFPVK